MSNPGATYYMLRGGLLIDSWIVCVYSPAVQQSSNPAIQHTSRMLDSFYIAGASIQRSSKFFMSLENSFLLIAVKVYKLINTWHTDYNSYNSYRRANHFTIPLLASILGVIGDPTAFPSFSSLFSYWGISMKKCNAYRFKSFVNPMEIANKN